jgi:hypothetical protein
VAGADPGRIEALRADARYRRERADLYRAKSYGDRPTRPARLRELQLDAERAEERLRHALSELEGQSS